MAAATHTISIVFGSNITLFRCRKRRLQYEVLQSLLLKLSLWAEIIGLIGQSFYYENFQKSVKILKCSVFMSTLLCGVDLISTNFVGRDIGDSWFNWPIIQLAKIFLKIVITFK